MNEKGWMMCEVLEETHKEYLLQGELFDGTRFELAVPKTIAVRTEDGKRAWLEVEWQGKEPGGSKVSIVLPKPVLNFGHRISIHESRLNKNIFVKPDIVRHQGVLPNKVLATAFPQPFSPANAQAEAIAELEKGNHLTSEEVVVAQEKPPFTPAEAGNESTTKDH